MEQILVLDPDPIHVAELEHALHPSRWVSVYSELQQAVDAVRTQYFDLVVMVPGSPCDWRADAQSLRDALRQFSNPPEIMCILRGHCKGPSDRLEGDRLDVKVVYER